MAEDIKSLIEKINQEGVQAAEAKAKEIENEARLRAAEIIGQAKRESARILAEAKENTARTEDRGKALVAQAARDMLLVLRREINAMLQRIIVQEARDSLRPEQLVDILAELIKGSQHKASLEIIITLKKEDLHLLEKHLVARLNEEARSGITLKPAEEIAAGFTISFDAGKSEFDFTDKALAEYIGNYLKPKLKAILDEATQ